MTPVFSPLNATQARAAVKAAALATRLYNALVLPTARIPEPNRRARAPRI